MSSQISLEEMYTDWEKFDYLIVKKKVDKFLTAGWDNIENIMINLLKQDPYLVYKFTHRLSFAIHFDYELYTDDDTFKRAFKGIGNLTYGDFIKKDFFFPRKVRMSSKLKIPLFLENLLSEEDKERARYLYIYDKQRIENIKEALDKFRVAYEFLADDGINKIVDLALGNDKLKRNFEVGGTRGVQEVMMLELLKKIYFKTFKVDEVVELISRVPPCPDKAYVLSELSSDDEFIINLRKKIEKEKPENFSFTEEELGKIKKLPYSIRGTLNYYIESCNEYKSWFNKRKELNNLSEDKEWIKFQVYVELGDACRLLDSPDLFDKLKPYIDNVIKTVENVANGKIMTDYKSLAEKLSELDFIKGNLVKERKGIYINGNFVETSKDAVQIGNKEVKTITITEPGPILSSILNYYARTRAEEFLKKPTVKYPPSLVKETLEYLKKHEQSLKVDNQSSLSRGRSVISELGYEDIYKLLWEKNPIIFATKEEYENALKNFYSGEKLLSPREVWGILKYETTKEALKKEEPLIETLSRKGYNYDWNAVRMGIQKIYIGDAHSVSMGNNDNKDKDKEVKDYLKSMGFVSDEEINRIKNDYRIDAIANVLSSGEGGKQ